MVQSSTGRGGSHPNPPPQNEYAKRLEHIRHLKGVPDVKAFWARLVDRYDEDQVRSYASARYYHYDRDPPVDYLRQVSVVYDVPLEYLVFGEGWLSRLDEARSPSQEDSPEVVGYVHIRSHFPAELKGEFRVFGAISEALISLALPRSCQSIIEDYLVHSVQCRGAVWLGWRGGVPEEEDVAELTRLASAAIEQYFGSALQHRATLRPGELVVSVMATAIPLYLSPGIQCPGCGRERPFDRQHNACPECGESYPDLFVSSEPNTPKED